MRPDKQDFDQKRFEVVAVISIRKAQFYEKIEPGFLAKMPAHKRTEAKSLLTKIVSKLDNRFFIGRAERANDLLDPATSIDQLNLDITAIERAIAIEIDAQAITKRLAF